MSLNTIIVEHDPKWADDFEALAAILTPVLGDLARSCHHVGSTAIPGLAAKPIIDIDIELAPAVTLEAATTVLTPLGYEYQGEQGIPGRHAYHRSLPSVPFSKQRAIWPAHHLYACPFESAELTRHLRFRDALRNNAEWRQEYLALKQEAVRLAAGVRQVYVDEKARVGAAFFSKVLEA